QPGSLPGQWTCLAGVNGSGKSSILQALSLALLGDPLYRELGGDRLDRMRRLRRGRRDDAIVRAWLEHDNHRYYVEIVIKTNENVKTIFGSQPPASMRTFWKWMRSRVVVAYGATRNLSEGLSYYTSHERFSD